MELFISISLIILVILIVVGFIISFNDDPSISIIGVVIVFMLLLSVVFFAVGYDVVKNHTIDVVRSEAIEAGAGYYKIVDSKGTLEFKWGQEE